MKSTPRVPGDRPLMDIGYKSNSRKVIRFIANERYVITEPSDPYLSNFPDIYLNASVHPVFRPHLIGRYLNACNAIDNQNMMSHYDLEIEKY